MEVEFVAYFEATIQGSWLRNLSRTWIVDFIANLLRIYYDNTAILFFSKDDKYSKGDKHIKLKYFTVKEEIQKQRMSIEHIRIELMIANPLTKELLSKTFNDHINKMSLDRNP